MGRGDGGDSSTTSGNTNNPNEFDDVILGGNPTFSSRSSGQFAPQSSQRAVMPRPPNAPPANANPASTLPPFPDLRSQSVQSGPRRISVGESAVFERRVGRSPSGSTQGQTTVNDSRRQSRGNDYGPQMGGNSNFQSGGVSIKGDSSIFSSTGFVGGGGSTSVFSGGSGGSAGSFTSGISSGTRSQATPTSFNTNNNGVNSGNVGNSFRDGTGRDYSSSSSFGNVARNAGQQQQQQQQQQGRVNIRGDSSIFSSSGFVGGGNTVNNGYDTSGTRRGQSGGVRAQAPSPPKVSYGRGHVFDAPPRSPQHDNDNSFTNGFGAGQTNDSSYSSVATPPNYNTGPNEYNHNDNNGPYSTPTPPNNHNPYSTSSPPQPQSNSFNSGQSLADNFLTTKSSVRRSGPVPNGDDYDPDDEMLGYESPTRRGDGFLTEPEPQFVNMPVHTGKWMSELYAEQGLDLFSGGAVGFGVVKGEVQRGGGNGGGGNSGSFDNRNTGGYQLSPGYGMDNNGGYDNGHGYSENENSSSSRNMGYANNDGYASSNSNNGYVGNNNNGGYANGGSFGRFGETPPQGY